MQVLSTYEENVKSLIKSDYYNKQTLENTEGAIKKGKSRENGNIEYTRHRTKKNKQKHNTEILSTLGTPETGQRQTNKNTTQRYCQH